MPPTSAVTLNATSVTDNTKVASATINLSTGTVQLVPQSLNFGRHVVNQPSAPQSIALTNTGTATLTFTGIAFGGTNAGDFSQTNTCGSSVAAAASCTISVVFKPAAQGTRSATMSIADSSTDSPQQVSLAGIGITRRASDVSAVKSVLSSSTIAVVPLPTGSEPVGTRILHWVDRSRPDPFVAHSVSREQLVRLWYPASLKQPCEAADYASPRVWSYISHLLGVPLPAVRTNSGLDAPVASGFHPVVVFTHGYTGTFTDYTFLFEDLASRGYIVVSVNHTYEATATEFPMAASSHQQLAAIWTIPGAETIKLWPLLPRLACKTCGSWSTSFGKSTLAKAIRLAGNWTFRALPSLATLLVGRSHSWASNEMRDLKQPLFWMDSYRQKFTRRHSPCS